MKKRKSNKKQVRVKSILERVPRLKTLNPEQKAAQEKMCQFLNSEDQFFLLKGSAGTGKTHTVGALIAQLQAEEQRYYFACAAPTNKAVKVLKSSTQKWGTHNLDYGTIYHFLGLTMDYDEQGSKVLVEGHRSTMNKYELIFLDEASMVSSKLWDLLKQIVARYDVKIICLGDNYQLNPVNEPDSPVFSEIKLIAELTQIMRTDPNNPVRDMIQAAREKVFNHERDLPRHSSFTPEQMKGVWVLNRGKWLEQMIRAFQSPKYQNDPDYVRAIAWTNRTVNYLNQYIREAIYEEANKPYLPGERLMATDTIFDPVDGEEILLNSSDEFEVVKARPSTSDGYNIWRLKVVDAEGTSYRLKVIDASSQDKFSQDLRKLAHQAHRKQAAKEKKPWANYWKHKNRYAQVNYNYAITSHKSQGSTYANVFVAQNDICRNPNLVERYRSLYVSYSRSQNRLIINV